MITRFWHGRTISADAEIYRDYVKNTGIKGLTNTEGNLGAQIWQKTEGDITHIYVVSWWDNYESIKAFAGNEIEKARYYEEDKKYLLELEPHVQHFAAFDYRKFSGHFTA
jgi:heme-degrading monooxygenase HmoA